MQQAIHIAVHVSIERIRRHPRRGQQLVSLAAALLADQRRGVGAAQRVHRADGQLQKQPVEDDRAEIGAQHPQPADVPAERL
jgi:hypothetical protein